MTSTNPQTFMIPNNSNYLNINVIKKHLYFKTMEINFKSKSLYFGACSSSPSCSVHIILIMVGAAIVYNKNQMLHIEASGSNRCSHKKFAGPILKIIYDAISVILINACK